MNTEPYFYDDDPRPDVLPLVPSSARRVLDVGCGTGAFGQALKRSRPDVEVWGIEPHLGVIPAAEVLLDRVVVGRFPEDVPDRHFDVVCFNDVLEHLVDPWGALLAAAPILSAGGCVVASIPNVRHYSVIWALVRHGEWRYRDVGILDRTHLRFFTRSSMVRAFTDAGYAIDTVKPVRLTPPRGRIPSVLHALGRLGVDFLAERFVVVARPLPTR